MLVEYSTCFALIAAIRNNINTLSKGKKILVNNKDGYRYTLQWRIYSGFGGSATKLFHFDEKI